MKRTFHQVRRVAIGVTALLAGVLLTASPASASAPYCQTHTCTRPAAYPIGGVDVSSSNHPAADPSINWTSVADAGNKWTEIKATQGTTYTNPFYDSDMAAAYAAGLDVTPYHYWSSADGAAQAAYFIAAVRTSGYTGQRSGDLPPMLDLEACAAKTTLANVQAFLTAVQNAFGRTPLIYTSVGEYAKCLSGGGLGSYPLIVANYAVSSPALPTGWSNWTMWQWSDDSTVPGINDPTDADVFNGTQDQLDALAHRSVDGGIMADFNGDGWPDVAAMNADGRSLYMSLNASVGLNPVLGAGQLVSTGWGGVRHLMAADFDGDGLADLLGVSGDSLLLWRNTTPIGGTTVTFAPYINLTAGNATVSQFLPPADYDGDGRPDIAAFDSTGNTLYITRNTSTPGHPSVGAAQTVTSGWAGVDHRTAIDFDLDGKADILGRSGDSLLVWRSTSTATTYSFAPYVVLSTGNSTVSRYLAPIDFNGDARPDIAAFNASGDGLYISRNTSTPGHPSLAEGQLVSTGWSGVQLPMVGDFNADGKADIIGRSGDWLLEWGSTSTSTSFTVDPYVHLSSGNSTVSAYLTGRPVA